ncbi:MAG: bifunctional hydroxymethylpyrimidine kinase/phosphomethylpyrimidine kinase [Alphaproteobacteria bacterium]|nr:bifunctional hydroxymethylpyrimidine kinase/phosphomethylpyrimidine kinase [Alphaproteobacteria bacterium]
MKGRVLIIAGSDSGGGAGVQADIKTVSALGGYAATAITALTAQNTEGVQDIYEVPPEFIAKQMEVVLSDIGADCIKVGMLHSAAVIDAVCDVLEARAGDIPIVVDPVMVAKGGASLLKSEALSTLKRRMVLIANVLTPNVPEAEALTGMTISSHNKALVAGQMLATLGPTSVFLKGAHLEGDSIEDLLFEESELVETFQGKRINTRHTHGTGCTTAAGIAAGLAQGMSIRDAVARARAFVIEAIRTAPGYGKGHGPLNHGHTVGPFSA